MPTKASGRRLHPWWIALGTLAAVVVVGVAVVGGAYVFRSHPKAKSVDSALDEYRESARGGGGSAIGFSLPAPGVYRATGTGRESISVPPNSQSDGPVMPITVTHLPEGCWRWRIDYNDAHWHEYDYCPQGKELLLVGQRNFQAWDLGATTITNTGTYTCDPPSPIVIDNPRPGQRFTHACVGENTAAPGRSETVGPATVVGVAETVAVGDVDVVTIHQRRRQEISGPQTGTIVEDWWFEALTGLPVRSERRYEIATSSPIGDIDYRERGSWQLSSLTPRT